MISYIYTCTINFRICKVTNSSDKLTKKNERRKHFSVFALQAMESFVETLFASDYCRKALALIAVLLFNFPSTFNSLTSQK